MDLIFLNEAGAAVSVNGLRYRTMINTFLWPELEDMDVDDLSRPSDFSKWRLQLAAKIMRFNTSRLFSLGSRER